MKHSQLYLDRANKSGWLSNQSFLIKSFLSVGVCLIRLFSSGLSLWRQPLELKSGKSSLGWKKNSLKTSTFSFFQHFSRPAIVFFKCGSIFAFLSLSLFLSVHFLFSRISGRIRTGVTVFLWVVLKVDQPSGSTYMIEADLATGSTCF